MIPTLPLVPNHDSNQSLMGEPEVQPPHTLILCRQNIILLLLRTHSVPNTIPDLISPDVEQLDEVK